MNKHNWVCIKAAMFGPDLWECTKCGKIAKDFELDRYNAEGCNDEQTRGNKNSYRVF
jgi:hypothetical protein